MKYKEMLLILLCLPLCSCQREVYQPTEISDAQEAVLSTPFTVPTEAPVNAAKDLDPATPQLGWETLYTEVNPVFDSETIIAILQNLYNRFMAQFDQPGWYRFYGSGDLGERVTWVQINEPETGRFNGLLQLFDYPEQYAPGFMFPANIISPDGEIGFTHGIETQDDYYFETPPDYYAFLFNLERTLDNLGYFTNDIETGSGPFGHLMLLKAMQAVQTPVDTHGAARREFSFEGWVSTYETQSVFIIKTTTRYSGALPIMESSGERPVREESYTYFDLQNGGAIATKSDYWYQSGNMDEGDWWMINFHLVERFENLPEREQQIYDDALRRLDEFNRTSPSGSN